MSIQNISLFQALGAKIDYLDRRQDVISQNIANADTPNYKAHDMTKADFGTMVQNVTHDKRVRLAATDAGHFGLANRAPNSKDRAAKDVYEIAPGKNSVILDEQLLNANKVAIDHNLMMNLMKKNLAMISTAIGTNK
ncbi:MAG: flagellar basal body rod protein FlgB [Pseudobdellovibrionaceae bacterium]